MCDLLVTAIVSGILNFFDSIKPLELVMKGAVKLPLL